MAKVLVLYYSSWGHIEQMAYAAAEGAREAGAEVVVKRVPELVPTEIAQAAHYKTDQKAPIATVEELPEYDAIIIGTPTRYGTMTAQMKNFLDQTGGLWAQGKLIGKVGSVFTSTATQHGGQEATILTTHAGAAAPRHGGRRPALLLPGPDGRRSRSAAARPTAPRRSPPATARASRARSTSTAPASRASTWPRSPRSSLRSKSSERLALSSLPSVAIPSLLWGGARGGGVGAIAD